MDKKYDVRKIKDVVVDLYQAIVGEQPNEEIIAKMDSGIDKLVNLYQADPKVFYTALDTLGPVIDDYFENIQEEKVEYNHSKKIFEEIGNLFERKNPKYRS